MTIATAGSSSSNRRLAARKEAARDAVSARFAARLAAQRGAGLFPCGEECPRTGTPCCYVFATERGLREHQQKESGPAGAADASNAHQATYRGRGTSNGLGSAGTLVEMAARPGEGMLSANSRANRSSAAPPPALQVMHTPPLVAIAF